MFIGSWTKIILLLTAVVAVLQVIHLILLNHLDSIRLQKSKVLNAEKDSVVISPENEIKTLFSLLDDTLRNKHFLDSTGVYRIATVLQESRHSVFSTPIPDITLVTQCSFDHIFKLVSLAKRWQGPISVALYMEEDIIPKALLKVSQLIACSQVFKENVTFSLVSPVPAKNNPPLLMPEFDTDDSCDTRVEEENQNYSSTNKFPNNLLRNVARRATTTEFVVVIDVDMMPNENLRSDFLLFATQRGLFKKTHQYDKTVFVIPVFEAKDNVEPPLNKAQLLNLVETGEIRPFYTELCSKCQAPTNYDAWLNEPPGAEMAALFDVIWKDPWEPFYISSNNVPLYDERFKQYGFNRISQVCELHVAGYTFSVLNNGFLIHLGFKTSNSFHEEKEVDQDSNRMLFRQFKAELRFKYIDSSRKCY
ncbi:beta-1,4-glucuronyltransferase 1-like [Cimex lectularius]|uniref:Beta-1,4-glucuronyltransferase 1 n=1 Tax=Cimex lectularius TaxID=79782 RepID=A0A8I6R6D1_CIMLE|nr:beta-1,4-glucuronyltransferase 1-like [Cimex lectularius]